MTIPGAYIQAGLEAGKLILQGYFQLMRMIGKTKEEAHALYVEECDYFESHPPDTLPDPK